MGGSHSSQKFESDTKESPKAYLWLPNTSDASVSVECALSSGERGVPVESTVISTVIQSLVYEKIRRNE